MHGSALFTRGETQSLCTATVGRRGEQQKAESLLGGESSKRLFVNYSFPPFAVDDTQISEWGDEWVGWVGCMAGALTGVRGSLAVRGRCWQVGGRLNAF